MSPEEIDPPIRGDRRLIDAEDGDETEITINAYVLERYKESLGESEVEITDDMFILKAEDAQKLSQAIDGL